MADYYIDFGAANDGDGTSYAQAGSGGAVGAYKTFVGKTFAANDNVWIRRSATALTLSVAYTGNLASVNFYGWPLPGDDHYNNRPASAQAAWDGDAATHAKVTTSTSSVNFNPGGNNLRLRRFWIDRTSTSGPYYLIAYAGANLNARYIKSTCSALAVGSALSQSGVGNFTGANPIVMDFYGRLSVSEWDGFAVASGASYGYFRNITLDIVSSSPVSANAVLELSNVSPNKSLVLEEVTINYLDPAPSTHSAFAVSLMSGNVRINGLTVTNAYTGTGYAGPGINIAAPAYGCRIVNARGVGSMGPLNIAGVGHTVELVNWNNVYPSSGSAGNAPSMYTPNTLAPIVLVGTYTTGGHTISLTNSSLSTQSTSIKPIYLSASHSTILLNNVLTNQTTGLLTQKAVGPEEYQLFSSNHNQVPNAWHYEDRCTQLDTSNVYRTGGSTYSIRGVGLENIYGQNHRCGGYSLLGRETYAIALVAGLNTITLYGAYAGWAGTVVPAPTNLDFGFSFSYVDQTGTQRYVSTFSDAPLTSDSSTWNNDVGFVAFKITKQINVNADQKVIVHISLSPDLDSNGVSYVDPKLVVTQP